MRKLLILVYLLMGITTYGQLLWEKVELPLKHPAIYVSPHNIIFAIGTDHIILYRSFDEGTTWDSVNMPRTHNYRPIFSVDSSGTLYSLLENSLHVSTDDGENWKMTTLPYMYTQSIFATNDTLFVLAYGPQVFHSTDSGRTWVSRWFSNGSDLNWQGWQSSSGGNIFGFMQFDGSVHLVSTFPSQIIGTKFEGGFILDNDPISWMMFDQEGFGYGEHNGMLIRSSDEGLNWQAIDSSNSEYRKRNWGPYGALKGGGIIAVSDTETVVSYDQTDTWQGIGEGIPTGNWQTFATTRRGTVLVKSDSGLFRTSHFAAVKHRPQQIGASIGFDPMSKVLTVTDIAGNSRLVVTDIIGRVAEQQLLRDLREYRIDLSGLRSGTYMAVVISPNSTTSTMLSISR